MFIVQHQLKSRKLRRSDMVIFYMEMENGQIYNELSFAFKLKQDVTPTEFRSF